MKTNNNSKTNELAESNESALVKNWFNESEISSIAFSPKKMSSILDDVSSKMEKGIMKEVEETAVYFDPTEGVEYILLVEATTYMITDDLQNKGEKKRVDAIYFHAKEKGSKEEPKRYIDASTVSTKILTQILEKYGPFGCAVSLTFTGQVGNGNLKYNDYKIYSIH